MRQDNNPADLRPRRLIVGLGGTAHPNSSTEKALRLALLAASAMGADTLLLGAADLVLPMYSPGTGERTGAARHLVECLRRADGIIIASPGYHGSISGLVKNAIDYAEDLKDDPRPYFEGRAVGCIVTAAGWQATTTTLMALRSVVHALRGWPTPLGAAVNTTGPVFDAEGNCKSEAIAKQLETLGRQVTGFAFASAAMTGRG